MLRIVQRRRWMSWLEKHHSSASGVWLRLAKKTSGLRSLSYEEALQAALCYGWIDAKGQRIDENWWMVKFTPRRPHSAWSKPNRARALALIGAGEMRPAGLAEVKRARKDGRWRRP
jgi:uncharacterized protein YdeI (YjbR/CyaY-like superfamily)